MTNKAQPGHSVNNFIRIFNVLTERNLSFHINQVENGRKETFSLFNSRNISKQKQYFLIFDVITVKGSIKKLKENLNIRICI